MAQKVEVVLQPLYAPQAGRTGAVCSVLKIDDATFLLDCGWDERMGSEALEPLKKVCETVDAVLISHGDVEHCGALPFLVAQCGLRAPVFVTVPVHRLAQLLLYDLVSAKGRTYAADDLPVTLDQVDASLRLAAFGGSCRALRFREDVTVKGVTVMAEAAGRTLGGATWSLSRLTERVVYAHGVGTHRGLAIPNCALIPSSSSSGAAPARDVTLLVTECAASDAEPRALTEPPVAVKASEVTAQLAAVASAVEAGGNADAVSGIGSSSSSSSSSSNSSSNSSSSSSSSSSSATVAGVEALAGAIAETWRQQGNVLVPVDSGARLLEVLVGLEQSPALAAAPKGIVAVLSPVAPALMGHAAAFRDWSLAKPGVNPFALQRVRIAATVQELGRLPPPLCVLTPCPGMDEGFSRQLLPMWAADVRNTVIITSPPHPTSLAARLLRDAPAEPATTAFSVTATTVKCRVGFIDLSARVVAGGIAAVAAALGPRAVAVLNGQGADADGLASDAAAKTVSMIRAALVAGSTVVVAAAGDSLPLGSGAGMRSVRIAPALFTSLQFQEIGGCEVSLVRGYSAGVADSQAMSDAEARSADPAVDIVTAAATKQIRGQASRPSQGAATVLGAVWAPALSGAGQAAADEDEDEEAMVAAAGGAAAGLLNVPLEAREPLVLHAGPLPLRALFRAVARSGGPKPSLAPGVVRAGAATAAMPGQGRLLLSGTPGADFDRVKAAVRGLTGTV